MAQIPKGSFSTEGDPYKWLYIQQVVTPEPIRGSTWSQRPNKKPPDPDLRSFGHLPSLDVTQ